LRVDHPYLALLRRLVAGDQRSDDFLGTPTVAEHLERNRSKADVDEGLGGDGADAGLEPGHDRPDGVGMRLDGHAVATGERVASHDAVRHARSLAARPPPYGAAGPGLGGKTGGGTLEAHHADPTTVGKLPRRAEPAQFEEVPVRAFIVELQNRPGGLAALAEAIAERGINITNLAGVTCGGSGSVGLLTNDEASTKTVLDAGSFSYRQIDLISAALEDKPGTLGAAARRLADAGVNIELLLPTGMEGGKFSVAFGVDNAAAAQQALGELATVSR